ncbi:choline dehydrogenase [Sphingobium indicum IP26]|uniref:Choline dehydrogenase n=1 Tax=Sphingobium indicum F2 TaxID=1450518 RepID=A0A8E1C4K5_9SPHN|nr:MULTISPECIES: GMC family oxidoreductase N-terminal domain-containing protein [Sphingobium]EPR08982.1 choline dehydrogenase [Sphingobium indicum IP26]KER38424.1 choline dehydrogenase [Sphingobium indicum F2]
MSMAHNDVRTSYDYIVIGAGSSGCVVASRLSESGEHSVLLVEAGGPDTLFWMRAPLGTGQMLRRTDVIWPYETEGVPALNGRRLSWPRGKVVGGSSSVNGTIFIRGLREEYDRWRQMGNIGWGYDDVLPFFKKFENFKGGDPRYRGRGGPISVERLRLDLPVTGAFLDACAQAGIAANADYNGASIEGASPLQFNTRYGRRQSAAVGYLSPAMKRRNLHVLANTRVRKIDVVGGSASAVVLQNAGGEQTIRADREIIVSAGAIGSPQLLELSGIGNGFILKDAGIPVVHHLPGVGENLIDHLQTRISLKARNTAGLNELVRNYLFRMKVGAEWLFLGRGLMSTPLASAHAIVRSRPDAPMPDLKLQLHHFSGQDRMAYSKDLGIDPHPGLTIGVVQLSPRSRGHLHISSPNANAAPLIYPNQFEDEEDVRVLTAGIRMARTIASQDALSRFVVTELRPGAAASSDEEIKEYIRQSGQTSYHPIGTCKMGRDDWAVVDDRLRVRGVDRLRVVDASIMPTMPSSNTNAAALMIGEKGADLIRRTAA